MYTYVGIYRPYTALHRSDSFVSLWFKTVKMNGLYLESVSVDAINWLCGKKFKGLVKMG